MTCKIWLQGLPLPEILFLPQKEKLSEFRKWFFILNMVLFPYLLCEFSMQSQCCICEYVFFTEFDGITQHFLNWLKSILQNIIFLAALWVGGFFALFLFSKGQGWNTLKPEPDTILRPAGVKQVWHQICTEITAISVCWLLCILDQALELRMLFSKGSCLGFFTAGRKQKGSCSDELLAWHYSWDPKKEILLKRVLVISSLCISRLFKRLC